VNLPDNNLDESHDDFIQDNEEIHHKLSLWPHLTRNYTKGYAEAYNT
jgi:hypothetical protein